MRLATKLGLGVVAASAVVIAISGAFQMRKETLELRRAADKELRMLAAALQVAIEQALRDDQALDIQTLLDHTDLRDDSIDIFVLDPSGRVTQRSSSDNTYRHVVEPLVLEAQTVGEPILRFLGETEHLAAALPLRAAGGTNLGTLAMVRPLQELRSDLQTTRRAILLSFASQIAAIAIVVWWLVRRWIREPLAAIAGGMRAVRHGELSTQVPVPRHDELGALADEFNVMAADLKKTRADLAAETDSRFALEQGLQRVDKLVTVGQLSAGLAHEIGSPLQILAGRARTLLERPDSSREVKRQAGIILEQSERVARIVEQLLGFTRRSPPKMAETDVASAIRAVLDLLEIEARRRQVSLTFACERNLPKLWADADRVQQVVLNLVKNAIKATGRGGTIQLTLGESSFCHARGTPEQPSVLLTVDDDGVGMDPDAAGRAFEPFFSNWSDSQGTGLGLAVVKTIVDDHGGMITLRSTAGKGTHIHVHLPRQKAIGATGGEP